ncbi:MAG: hypothetical protein RMK29_07900 [Myxococcales bacterium]|nr:hypothetical protein [Myxococcota bacterium]MDW8281617.1 hypothetical protein [Myxococcales bacterium]
MWTPNFSMIGRALVHGLSRWLAMMGDNPPLSRDPGLLCWQYLHDPPGERPATTPADVPAELPQPEGTGPMTWTPADPDRPSLHLVA